MNLEDLIDENGLQQDDYSRTGATFGKYGHLHIVGWSGTTVNSTKYYVVKCGLCSEDCELFGGGYFKDTKSHLLQGRIPCGCSKSPKWSKEQFATLCKRKAVEIGCTFLGFVGNWKGQKTKIRMSCEQHGEWQSAIINSLINTGRGCPLCGTNTVSQAKIKPDEVMIKSFFDSGAFHLDTKFWRSDRSNNKGVKAYWHMSCPECGESGESYTGNLQQGCRPCACSSQRQQECYINWLIDGHNTDVAIKFGIARNSKQRIKSQARHSVYILKQHSVYQFSDVTSCKKAERECKQELECGIVLKRDMPDGWSETTWVYNLDKIIEIYERNGGIRKENP